ncbi:MAG: hypothetical protein AAFQ68_12130 [Bacteroidota bacterium]
MINSNYDVNQGGPDTQESSPNFFTGNQTPKIAGKQFAMFPWLLLFSVLGVFGGIAISSSGGTVDTSTPKYSVFPSSGKNSIKVEKSIFKVSLPKYVSLVGPIGPGPIGPCCKPPCDGCFPTGILTTVNINPLIRSTSGDVEPMQIDTVPNSLEKNQYFVGEQAFSIDTNLVDPSTFDEFDLVLKYYSKKDELLLESSKLTLNEPVIFTKRVENLTLENIGEYLKGGSVVFEAQKVERFSQRIPFTAE